MNKTINLNKEKSPFSMAEQHSKGVPNATHGRHHKSIMGGDVADKSRI